jgi:hypothetical protein
MAAAAGLGRLLPAGGYVWLERFGIHPHHRQIAALGAEEQALQKQSKLGLTSEQKKRQQTLKNDLVVARKAFESLLDELRD